MSGSQTFVVTGRPPQAGQRTDITSGLALPQYNYVERVLTDPVTETYTFKNGGVVVSTVIIVYTNSSLQTILNVTKT